jgi:hypothetical protein
MTRGAPISFAIAVTWSIYSPMMRMRPTESEHVAFSTVFAYERGHVRPSRLRAWRSAGERERIDRQLRDGLGPGVKTRLHDAHRHSCTISSFFLRVPRRTRLRPPRYGQVFGTFAVWGTRAMRGMADIYNCIAYHGNRKFSSRILQEVAHGNWTKCASRILVADRAEEGAALPVLARLS